MKIRISPDLLMLFALIIGCSGLIYGIIKIHIILNGFEKIIMSL